MFVTNLPPNQEVYVQNCCVQLSYAIDVPMALNLGINSRTLSSFGLSQQSTCYTYLFLVLNMLCFWFLV